MQIGAGKGLESVVLFALDQFCLIGYALRCLELPAQRQNGELHSGSVQFARCSTSRTFPRCIVCTAGRSTGCSKILPFSAIRAD